MTNLGSFALALGIDLTLGSLIGLGIQFGIGREAILMASIFSFPKVSCFEGIILLGTCLPKTGSTSESFKWVYTSSHKLTFLVSHHFHGKKKDAVANP